MHVRRKLAFYSLVRDHPRGGPKARGFELILGITLDHIDHLETEIRSGILEVPITGVRVNRMGGFNCVVELRIQGVEERRQRRATVRTIWRVPHRGAKPRLVTAFPRS